MQDSSQVFVSRFTCGSEAAARSLVNALLVTGLLPELHEPQLPDHPWEIVAAAQLVPTQPNLTELRDAMADAAERSGASFDGCEPDG